MEMALTKPLDVEQFYMTLLNYIHHETQKPDDDIVLFRPDIKEELKSLLTLKSLNARDGLEMAKGDITVYKNILDMFSKTYYDSADVLSTYPHEKETYEKSKKLLMQIKELTELIGAYPLARIIALLEENLLLENENEYHKLIDKYRIELRQVLYSIEFIV